MDEFRLSYDYGEGPALSAHNRSVTMRSAILCNETELSDGGLARRRIAVARSWDLEFKRLPHTSENTVDGGMGVEALRTLVETVTVSSLYLTTPLEDGTYEVFPVLFRPQSYSETLVSRRAASNWKSDVGFTLDETIARVFSAPEEEEEEGEQG